MRRDDELLLCVCLPARTRKNQLTRGPAGPINLVQDQRRVEDGKAERREDLNKEQHSRSLRSPGETAFEKFDGVRPPANLALRVTFSVIYPAAPA